MNFARPDLLWWLLASLAALAAFLVWAWRKKQSLLRQFAQPRLLDTLTAGVSKGRQKARLGLLFLGVACVAISLARPQWGTAWEETKQRGLDIVVAIDTSRSMLAADLAPNRLARAKLAALDLMREAKSDRLGLVAFAGTAFLQCPLTLDEEAFRQSVQALDTTIIPQGGSALAESIRTALTAFEKEEDNHKVLVLFTDGEDHEEGALEAAKEAAQAGLRIFTIGVGTAEGELLRVTDAKGNSDFLKDDQGNAVKSRLNEGLLRGIATAANGFYLPLRGANVIETLYERGLAPLPKADISTKFIRRFHERFQWPLALGLVLLALEMFLSDRKRIPVQKAALENAGPMAKAALIALLLAASFAVEASPAGARRDFLAGRYKEAQEEYARLAETKPGDPRLRYNAGAAAYRAGAFDEAAEHFTAALRAEDVNLQQQAYYNLGNTFYRAGDGKDELAEKISAWEQAVKHYEAAHQLKADDADAKFNHDLVKKKLEELKKQQQQQQQQQPNQSQDEKKDEQPKQDQPQNQDQAKQDQQSQKNQPSPKQDGEQKDSRKDQPQPKEQTDQKQKEDGKSDQQTKEEQAGGQKDSQKQAEQKNPKSDQQGAKPQDESAQAQSGAAIGQMDLKQAMQLLDAQQGEVKALIFKPADPGKARAKTLKDW